MHGVWTAPVRHNRATRSLATVIVAALTLAACGGNSADKTPGSTAAAAIQSPATTVQPQQRDYSHYYPPGTHKASPKVVAVILGWSNQLRAGHVKRAASYFSLPVIVQNASPPVRLTKPRDVFNFNNDLPCGAHVVRTLAADHSAYTVATFVLTERPNTKVRCGATGALAAAAFLLRHGKIAEWRRVLVPPPLGPASNLAKVQPQT